MLKDWMNTLNSWIVKRVKYLEGRSKSFTDRIKRLDTLIDEKWGYWINEGGIGSWISKQIQKKRETLVSWLRGWKFWSIVLLIVVIRLILLFLGIISIKSIYFFEIIVVWLLCLFVYRYFVKGTRFTIESLIKVLVILGVVLLVYLLIPDSSYSLGYVFERLGLKEEGGYIVIGSIVGFTALLWGLMLRNRYIEEFSNQILEDRFIRSVELTGKKELGIRLGGLAGLKVLATENVEMYKRVWEYLGGFLRNLPDLDREYTGIAMGDRPDIAYIAQILRERSEEQRRWEKDENFRLPLYRADLQGADLSYAHLQGADLRGTDLQGADLRGTDLQEAFLIEADLQEADLSFAHLQGTSLIEADLQGADLRGTDLQEANLSFAHLQGADLMEAHLQGANLMEAHLQEADLMEAHLQGANITRTDLRNTKYLTEEQLKTCWYYVSNPPRLPKDWDADKIGIKGKTWEDVRKEAEEKRKNGEEKKKGRSKKQT